MVQVLIKAIDILELVSSQNGESITLTEISNITGINQATAANIINTLIKKNYLEHIGKRKGYRLGSAAFSLSNSESYENNLIDAAKDVMKQLTSDVNESCLLGVLKNQKRYIIHVENSTQVIQVQTKSERNVYETATGRLLLAYLNVKQLDRFIDSNGLPEKAIWPDIQDRDSLFNALSLIKQEKLAKTYIQGGQIRGFAVPVFQNNNVIASVSVFIPDYRYTLEKEHQIIAKLFFSCDIISRNLDKF